MSYAYDELARIKERTLNLTSPFKTSFGYAQGPSSGTTTAIVERIQNGNDILSYTYDNIGNIETISENGELKATYHYDELNQLIREDNLYLNKSISYSYDTGGNILRVSEYAYTTGELGEVAAVKTYGYEDANWKDKLTSYNGQTITYDAIGNPLQYRDGMNFTWQNGRQLASINDNISYQYNDGGIRTQKTVNGVTTNYYLNGSTILSQVTGSDQMDFYYDDTGNLIGFSLNGASYYYVKNLQNDIIGILDSNGNQVVSYVYDSWGKLISTSGSLAETVGVQNPFRYRGYYYDVESEMYYLNSRYYDPIISRFVNSDGLILLTNSLLAISDKNLYEYCNNNPIVLNDDQGDLPNWIIGGIIGAAISVATTTINNICTGASVKEWIVSLGVAAITGGLSGVLAASGLPCKPLLDGVISGTGEAAHQLITTGTIDVPSVAYAGALGGTLSYVSAKLSNPANKMIDDGKDLIKKGNKRKANGKVSTRKSAKGAIKRGEAKINEGKALLHKGTAIALGIDVGSSLTSSFMGPPAPKTAVWCYPGTYVYM